MHNNQQSIQTLDDSKLSCPKVSVIIPLYYAEAFVDDLLTWLRSQPLKEIEIICVVDGSPDGTLSLVQNHAQVDQRIQWIYQENAGAGTARNAGLELARGEYLSFLDADDLYNSHFLVRMYEAAATHKADLAVCQFDRINFKTGREGNREGFRSNRVPVNRVFVANELENPLSDLRQVPNNKLYRREMIERAGLRFSETRVANDVFFVLRSIMLSQRIIAIPDSLIEMRRYINPHSISSNRGLYTSDIFSVFQDLYKWLYENGLWDCYASSYLKVWAEGLHYNATYGNTAYFTEAAVNVLGREVPWRKMDDRELFDTVRLDTSVLALKRNLIRFLPGNKSRNIELQRIDNELAAVKEVVRLLNINYGRNLPERSSLLLGVIGYLKTTGVRNNVSKLINRIKK